MLTVGIVFEFLPQVLTIFRVQASDQGARDSGVNILAWIPCDRRASRSDSKNLWFERRPSPQAISSRTARTYSICHSSHDQTPGIEFLKLPHPLIMSTIFRVRSRVRAPTVLEY